MVLLVVPLLWAMIRIGNRLADAFGRNQAKIAANLEAIRVQGEASPKATAFEILRVTNAADPSSELLQVRREVELDRERVRMKTSEIPSWSSDSPPEADPA